MRRRSGKREGKVFFALRNEHKKELAEESKYVTTTCAVTGRF
jgi:hypothetical protein